MNSKDRIKTWSDGDQRPPSEHKRLGQLASTAICGNDITSSCLYVSALAILYGGRWGPLALLMVGAVLYLYRSIYAEVVSALPLNGGAYNALLNTTSKGRASLAACLTILSYVATAVISASEAMHYARDLFPSIPVMGATVVLLGLFTLLTSAGIGESAAVATGIFLFHLCSLTVLLAGGVYYVSQHGYDLLNTNLTTPAQGGWQSALFFGFAAAMLGISGFESSANFVEEQEPDVFPKTLRNMWVSVSFFNPLVALLALALMPIAAVAEEKESLLAVMGNQIGGPWLSHLISIDATLVLSGAVLTSFVGVNGLVKRMTLDRCLPQFLLKENRRATTHRIIIAFFLLTNSILLITRGELTALAGVYTLSFLAVMLLFAIGNVLLKVKRSSLPRPSRASWLSLLLAMIATASALVGNAVLNPEYLVVFLEYFIPTMLVVGVMLWRIALLRTFLFVVRKMIAGIVLSLSKLTHAIRRSIDRIQSQQIVFFTRGNNLANVNQALLYILKNETTENVKLVHVVSSKDAEKDLSKLDKDVLFLREAYPQFKIDYVKLEGVFGPALIRELSREWKIPANFMFIGSPGAGVPHTLAELGGVRVIV